VLPGAAPSPAPITAKQRAGGHPRDHRVQPRGARAIRGAASSLICVAVGYVLARSNSWRRSVHAAQPAVGNEGSGVADGLRPPCGSGHQSSRCRR
jgi:hypothetical protein